MPTSASSVPYPSTDSNANERTPERGGGEGWAEHGAPAPRAGQRSVSRSPERGGGSESPAVAASAFGTRAHGLVICAKNVRESVGDEIATGELRAIDALGLRFPSPEMVTAAAALFEPAAPWARGRSRRGTEPESGRFRITVGPGVVRLGWTNPVRAERAAERSVGRHAAEVDEYEVRVKDTYERARQLEPEAVIALAQRDSLPPSEPGHGATISEWSRKSRSMMCRTFAELDYSPMVESGHIPAMVTLTYPGDWEVTAPDGASVKRHMVLWRKRFQREYGEPARYIWKLEFQRRGAPHIHLWMAPPMSPGRSGLSFAQWLSAVWAEIVDHPDPVQKARHRSAGIAIDVLSGLKACDPKRLAIYFTKHSSPNMNGDKEYQHIVPEPWRQPGRGPGRFWGVYGLKKAIAVVEVAQVAYLTARRIVRRWSRSQAAYGDSDNRFPTSVIPRTVVRMVPRVDEETGVVTHRKVRRRRTFCNQGGLGGGYVLVNSGPGFAAQLARAIV
ncbi:hypothetical protein ACJEIK_03025 [Mycobacterium sp. SMC-16]|uniref:rolling circle replication-associated protein n=1 Tax=Mycobacterium sp. SMC-16 TaxID=3385967 RepID=UPI00390CD782